MLLLLCGMKDNNNPVTRSGDAVKIRCNFVTTSAMYILNKREISFSDIHSLRTLCKTIKSLRKIILSKFTVAWQQRALS